MLIIPDTATLHKSVEWHFSAVLFKLLIKSSTLFALLLLRLRVKQKALQLLFYFFLSFLLVSVFRRTVKGFLATFYHLLPSKCVIKVGLISLDKLKKSFRKTDP